MRLCCSVVTLLLCATSSLGAQAVPPDSGAAPTLSLVQPGLRERAARRGASDSATSEPAAAAPSLPQVLGRAGLGTLGAGLGALGGGLAGYALLPHSDCHCDDPGMREFAIGAAVGTVAGAAVAAALPRQRSQCSYGRRAVYGLLGAVAGGAL